LSLMGTISHNEQQISNSMAYRHHWINTIGLLVTSYQDMHHHSKKYVLTCICGQLS
jgi:hypothetical protein